jgi:hypothetical protein
MSSHRIVPILITGVAASVLCACSGSSSSGGTPASSAPAGEKTAPAVKSESFHGISAKVNHRLGIPLPLLRGVASEVYYPPTHTLTVTFRSTADKTDQSNVENIVRQYKQQANANPTKTQKSSASPTS